MGGDTHDASYYAKCMVGGLLACGLTHTAIVPLDVVKCRRQVFRIFNILRYLKDCIHLLEMVCLKLMLLRVLQDLD